MSSHAGSGRIDSFTVQSFVSSRRAVLGTGAYESEELEGRR
jgi:hypothetical protein